MLLKQLSLDDKRDFLCIAELLSLADKPILRVSEPGLTIPASLAGAGVVGAVVGAGAVGGPVFDILSKWITPPRTIPRTIPAGTISSIQRGERESAAIAELVSICEKNGDAALDGASGARIGRKDIEWALVKRIGMLPRHTAEEPAARATVALDVLREVLKGRKAEMPSVPKVMLFELMLFVLAKGSISSIEWQLLNEFRHHHQLEKHVFDDLLERAECAHREAQKTLAIILE